MTFKSKQIKQLIDAPQDHLEILDAEVVLVNGPSFAGMPVTMITEMQHSESKLKYYQLIKMPVSTAEHIRNRIDDSIANIDELEDT